MRFCIDHRARRFGMNTGHPFRSPSGAIEKFVRNLQGHGADFAAIGLGKPQCRLFERLQFRQPG